MFDGFCKTDICFYHFFMNLIFCFQEMDTVPSVKDDIVTSTEVKANVTPILQPFTSTEEKSAPFFDVSSNIYIL